MIDATDDTKPAGEPNLGGLRVVRLLAYWPFRPRAASSSAATSKFLGRSSKHGAFLFPFYDAARMSLARTLRT